MWLVTLLSFWEDSFAMLIVGVVLNVKSVKKRNEYLCCKLMYAWLYFLYCNLSREQNIQLIEGRNIGTYGYIDQ